ncbi:hypothetical protein ACM26V_09290 [Salipaludibacillus sp. HK11]|uniref:hypothetical protein n=1 Tax=Salipaludibacillus sp. HK11 TaxID=3394320 RepID=UPI0039FD9E8B
MKLFKNKYVNTVLISVLTSIGVLIIYIYLDGSLLVNWTASIDSSLIGAFLGALMTGGIAIIIMNRNFDYDKKVRRKEKLDNFIKSASIIDIYATNIAESLKVTFDFPVIESDAHHVTYLSALKYNYRFIDELNDDYIFENVFEDYHRIKVATNYAVSSIENTINKIDDERYNGLEEYISQIEEHTQKIVKKKNECEEESSELSKSL